MLKTNGNRNIWQGTNRSVIDATGTPVNAYDHYPYGLRMPGRHFVTDGEGNRYQFTGHQYDEETTFEYHGARYYNRLLGRYMSVDPLAAQAPGWSPYRYCFDNPIRYIDPDGRFEDDHYINKDGSIQTVKTNDKFDRFYTQNDPSQGGYTLEATLDKNESGLVAFPESGNGFSRYGMVDAGGQSTSPPETVGSGDHYLKPEAAASLFGVINELRSQGITISLGDMSSSNGSDPWQLGQRHHAGHGHNGKRSGLDADFRYINNNGSSFQSSTATSSSNFSMSNNTAVYSAANRFGFTKNYQGTAGKIPGVTKVGGHDDHGHLGLVYSNMNWKYVSKAPTNPSIRQQYLFPTW